MLGRLANFINGELFGRITDVKWAVKFPTEVHHLDFLKRYYEKTGTPFPSESYPQHSPEILAVAQEQFGDVSKFVALLNPRHPSQLYEAAGEGLLLAAVLYFIRVRCPRLPHGILTGLFFILYALIRIALENYREPDSGSSVILGLTKGQFFSTFMIAAGLGFLAHGLLRGRRSVALVKRTEG